MHTNTTHVIYWDGTSGSTGVAFASTYTSAINQFLNDVAAADGSPNNVYGITPEYSDSSGFAQYSTHTTPAIVDHTAYPTADCVDPAEPTDPCVTDLDLQTEIAKYVGTNDGVGDVYFIVTPPGVASCIDASATDCAYTTYCAYHSDFIDGAGHEVIYASEPDQDITPPGSTVAPCQASSGQQYPADGTSHADPTIDGISHEHNEAITDPLGDAWYWTDNSSFPPQQVENGDNCLDTYGPLQGSSGQQYDQTINGDHYFIQLEWSNAGGGCLPTDEPPTARFNVVPGSPTASQPASFDGSPSQDADGTLSFSWQFGDGSTGSGALPSHTYASPGNYTVTLTVTDAGGQTATATHTVSVGGSSSPAPAPQPPPPSPPPATLTGTLSIPNQRLKTVLQRGLLVHFTSNLAAGADLSLLVSRRTGRKLHAPKHAKRLGPFLRLALASDNVGSNGSGDSRLTLSRAEKKHLRHSRSLTVTVQLTLTDASGHSFTTQQPVTITR